MPALHAKKGPSGAKRLHECAGAGAFVGSLPLSMRSSSGKAAQFGTAAHLLLETSLRLGVEPSVYRGRLILVAADAVEGEDYEETVMLKPRAKLPKSPEERARTFEVDDEMISNVDTAWTYVAARLKKLGLGFDALQLETRTNPCPDRTDTWGTADITIDDAWTLEVVDYKNGRLVVEHKANPQVLAYLAGRAHDTGWSHEEYVVTIVQPNGRHHEGKVRSYPVPKEELLAFVEKHRAAAIKADLAADAFYKAGHEATDFYKLDEKGVPFPHATDWSPEWLSAGEHCTFCDARPVCAIHRVWFEGMAKASSRKEFAEVLEKDPAAELHIAGAEQAKAIIKWRHLLMPQFKAAERYLEKEAKAGRIPTGWKVVRGRTFAKLKPDSEGNLPEGEDLAFSMYMDGLLTAEQYLAGAVYQARELRTGPQIRDMIPSKLRPEFIARYLHIPPGTLKLVPEDAPGEAVVFDAKADFAEVLETDEEEDY